MNDSRSGEAAEPAQAIAGNTALVHLGAAVARVAPADPQVLSHREKRLIAMSMMLPVFLGSVDQSVLASALPTIGRDLGEVHHLPWLVTAFLFASTALTPLYGKFADIHGRPISISMFGEAAHRQRTGHVNRDADQHRGTNGSEKTIHGIRVEMKTNR
jgi:hypothetical protein